MKVAGCADTNRPILQPDAWLDHCRRRRSEHGTYSIRYLRITDGEIRQGANGMASQLWCVCCRKQVEHGGDTDNYVPGSTKSRNPDSVLKYYVTVTWAPL